jgi:predicted N-acetyltransferase YhbS
MGNDMLKYRQLNASDLDGLHDIDRSDFSSTIYRVRHGELILEDCVFRHPGFTSAEWDNTIRALRVKLLDGTTLLFGAFDGPTLVGISGLDVGQYRGAAQDMLNMSPLWVNSSHRRGGIGKQLLDMTCQKGREMGARALYISATPVPSTVAFYHRAGGQLLSVPDRDLFALEPDDIHMELALETNKTETGDA